MKHRTTFEKLPQTNVGRIKNWKTLRTICLLLFLSVSFTAYSQITVNMKDISLRASLKKLEQVSNYKFFYNENLPELEQKVSLNVQNATIEQTMVQLLSGMELTYKQEQENVIVLIRKKQQSKQMIRKISGKVVDENGTPIIGASVLVKGTSNGTITDLDGRYTLNNVLESGTISISYIGFSSREYKANSKDLQRIILNEDSKMIDEVVVVGYGVQRKRDVTTSIASLKSSDLEMPVTSIEQAFVGKMAGVQVTQPSGAPGGAINIKVRGTGTISAGSDPLYVIDGMPMSDDTSDGTGLKVGVLTSLNSNDIESVEILKDASAAAIYGSRGSNGVVIITTKKGKEGKPVVKYNGYVGVQSKTKKIDVLDAYEYSHLVYDGHNNAYFDALAKLGRYDGLPTDNNQTRWEKMGKSGSIATNNAWLLPPQIMPYINGEEGLTNTDWQDEVMRNAFVQDHSVSVSGGTKAVKYFLSGTYRDEEGIVIGSDFQKIGGRGKFDVNYNKFKFGANFNFMRMQYDLISSEGRYSDEGILSTALGMAPIFPVKNQDGSYNFEQYNYSYGNTNILNPVALANEVKDKMTRFQVLVSAYGEYEILKGLNFRTALNLSYDNYVRNYYRPASLPSSAFKTPPSNPEAESRTKNKYSWVWENTLSYNTKIKKDHSINAIIGWTAQKYNQLSNRITATDLPMNDLYETIPSKSTATNQDSGMTEWSLLSALGRVQYSFKDRYLVSAALRTDGSSRFGKDNRWGYFPSASLGWYVTEEKFMHKIKWISNLKLRASYGVTGNFSIGNYASMATINNDNYILGTDAGNMVIGMKENTAGNRDLGWEKTTMFDVGFEIGFLNNMINLEVDFYNGNTTDMLLEVPVLEYSGFSTILKNIGKVNNKGMEITLSTNNKIGKLYWTNTANFSINRNEVKDLGGAPSIITQYGKVIDFITMPGESIGSYYTYVTDGVYRNQREIDESLVKVPGAKPGDFKFKKVGDDDTIDANDKTITGNYMPDFTYGFSTSLKYKIFDLSCSLQGVYGNEIANINRRYLANMEGNANSLGVARERWISEDNPGSGQVYKANRKSTGMNSSISTWHIEDGSYLRIRDITLGVTMPKKWIQKAGISSARIYFTSFNPFTFTKYSGYNPEVSISTDPTQQGVDYGTYPLAKSFIVGLNLSF